MGGKRHNMGHNMARRRTPPWPPARRRCFILEPGSGALSERGHEEKSTINMPRLLGLEYEAAAYRATDGVPLAPLYRIPALLVYI